MTGKSDDSNEFGKWLFAQMQGAGYTQKQLGHLLGISDAQVNRIVHAERKPSLEVVDKSAQLFRADANFLREMAGYPTIEATVPMRPLVLQAVRVLNRLSLERLRLALRMLQAMDHDEDPAAR
jgi:transcriptional regulator with XRE-family HTH domain